MFYPVDSLRRGGRFYLCWVADSWPLRFKNVSFRQIWSQDIRDLCEDLNEVIVRESGSPSNRFSLRLSSQLMRGLVRLYERKVNSFIGNLCMLDASILRKTNKKWEYHEKPKITGHFPKIVIRELLDEEQLEERIQASGNVIANIQDITIREELLPERRLPVEGFGEENANQAMQMLNNRTLEVMMAGDEALGQVSGVDVTNLQDMDKSKDPTKLQADVHMEQMPNLDITSFRHSAAVDELLHIQTEIPPIPDIQLELPAPSTTEQQQMPEIQTKIHTVSDTNKAHQIHLELEELEALDVMEIAQRRKKNKLILDKKTQLDGDFIRSRLQNVNVECYESISECIIRARPISIDTLLRGPSYRFLNASPNLTVSYIRNLGYIEKPLDKDIQEMLEPTRMRRTKNVLNLERIEEEIFTPKGTAVQPSVADQEICAPQEQNFVLETTNKEQEMDISEVPTQVLRKSVPQKRQAREEQLSPAKKSRIDLSGQNKIIEKQPQEKSLFQELPVSDTTTSQRPQQQTLPISETHSNLDQEPRISQMLEAAGLADLRNTIDVQGATNGDVQKKIGESFETPLGSLDRTKVSLGDSDKTTESIKMIFERWGTEGTMFRIAKLFKRGVKSLTVASLLESGPSLPGRRKIVAARCFTSLLKLKQHGFINLTKDPVTLQINTIKLSDKFL